MTQQTQDANDVLMGGGGPPAWKFDDPGTTRIGTICSYPKTRQERDYDPNNPGGGEPKFFPSGDPIMGIIIEVQTDERTSGEDDGKRTFYAEGRYVKEALREAVKSSGAAKLEVGARLQVTFTHREDPMDKRSRKYWAIQYTPAAQTVLEQPAAPAPAPPAWVQPPAAPAAPAAQQFVQTPQGLVDTATGQIVAPPQQQTAPPAPAPVPVPAPPTAAPTNGPTPEAVAAVRASGVDPATVWPGVPLPG